MKAEIRTMTNRELFTEYENETGSRRYEALTEMAKRVNQKMIMPDTVAIFSQYKLNGAGDQRW